MAFFPHPGMNPMAVLNNNHNSSASHQDNNAITNELNVFVQDALFAINHFILTYSPVRMEYLLLILPFVFGLFRAFYPFFRPLWVYAAQKTVYYFKLHHILLPFARWLDTDAEYFDAQVRRKEQLAGSLSTAGNRGGHHGQGGGDGGSSGVVSSTFEFFGWRIKKDVYVHRRITATTPSGAETLSQNQILIKAILMYVAHFWHPKQQQNRETNGGSHNTKNNNNNNNNNDFFSSWEHTAPTAVDYKNKVSNLLLINPFASKSGNDDYSSNRDVLKTDVWQLNRASTAHTNLLRYNFSLYDLTREEEEEMVSAIQQQQQQLENNNNNNINNNRVTGNGGRVKKSYQQRFFDSTFNPAFSALKRKLRFLNFFVLLKLPSAPYYVPLCGSRSVFRGAAQQHQHGDKNKNKDAKEEDQTQAKKDALRFTRTELFSYFKDIEIQYDSDRIFVAAEQMTRTPTKNVTTLTLRASGPARYHVIDFFVQCCLDYYVTQIPVGSRSVRYYYELLPPPGASKTAKAMAHLFGGGGGGGNNNDYNNSHDNGGATPRDQMVEGGGGGDVGGHQVDTNAAESPQENDAVAAGGGALDLFEGKPSRLVFKKYLLSSTRQFDTFFFPQKEKMLKLMDSFYFRKGRFAIEGFPYKLGFLLYGPSGTGKTTFVKCLADYFGRHVVSVPLEYFGTNQQLCDVLLNGTCWCLRSGGNGRADREAAEEEEDVADTATADTANPGEDGAAAVAGETAAAGIEKDSDAGSSTSSDSDDNDDDSDDDDDDSGNGGINKKDLKKETVNWENAIYVVDNLNSQNSILCARSRSRKVLKTKPTTLSVRPFIQSIDNNNNNTTSENDDCMAKNVYLDKFIAAHHANPMMESTNNNNTADITTDEDEEGEEEGDASQQQQNNINKTEEYEEYEVKFSEGGQNRPSQPNNSNKNQKENKKQNLFDLFDNAADRVDLSSLLNILDGVVDTPGRIIIFITDHPERLDPALVRPGRMSTKIKFDYITFETLVSFVGLHFGSFLPHPSEADDADTHESSPANGASELDYDHYRPLEEQKIKVITEVLKQKLDREKREEQRRRLLAEMGDADSSGNNNNNNVDATAEEVDAAAAAAASSATAVTRGMAKARLRHKVLTKKQIYTLFHCIKKAEKEKEQQDEEEEKSIGQSNNNNNNNNAEVALSTAGKNDQVKHAIKLQITPAEIEMICGFCRSFEEFVPFFDSLIHGELNM